MNRLSLLLISSTCLLALITASCARHSARSYRTSPVAQTVPSPAEAQAQASVPDQPLPAEGSQASIQPPPRIYQYQPDIYKAMGPELRLSEICKEVAGKVFYELKAKGDRHQTAKVAVVGAVPLSDFKRESEFGRLMAEYLLTDLADRGLQVTELRLGKEIHILPQTGEFIMSRNIGELANNLPILDYVVVTTFSNTSKTLILQGRLVSLHSGLVETSWRYTLPLDRELLGLFNERERPFTIAVKGFGQ